MKKLNAGPLASIQDKDKVKQFMDLARQLKRNRELETNKIDKLQETLESVKSTTGHSEMHQKMVYDSLIYRHSANVIQSESSKHLAVGSHAIGLLVNNDDSSHHFNHIKHDLGRPLSKKASSNQMGKGTPRNAGRY